MRKPGKNFKCINSQTKFFCSDHIDKTGEFKRLNEKTENWRLFPNDVLKQTRRWYSLLSFHNKRGDGEWITSIFSQHFDTYREKLKNGDTP